MRSVKVVVTWDLGQEAMDVIGSEGPYVEAVLVPYVESTHTRDLRRKNRLDELAAKVPPVSAQLLDHLRNAEIIFGLDYPSDLPSLAPNLRWVQMLGAGTDHLHGTGLLESDVVITTVGGFGSRAIAEYVINQMLCYAKQTRAYIAAEERQAWTLLWADTLAGKTVGIVGLGRIGSAVAHLCKAFDMRVLATRRSPTQETHPCVDQILPASRLSDMLPQCDYVVVTAALTAETRNMLGEDEIRLMKDKAFIVNVARGEIINEEALIAALQEGRIDGAGLDVFAQEPLPPDSPLWRLPNVSVTPHGSAAIVDYGARAARYFADNLTRYLAGEPLTGVVDKERGY